MDASRKATTTKLSNQMRRPAPSKFILLLLGAISVALGACRSGLSSAGVDPEKYNPSPRPNFLVFDAATSADFLGKMFDPKGTPSTAECYSFTTLPMALGNDSQVYTWNFRAGDTAALGIARVLGFRAAIGSSNRGAFRLDSVVYAEVQDLRPLSSCPDKVGSFPHFPAVSGMYGARGMSLSIATNSGRTVDVDSVQRIPGVDLTASHVSQKADSVLISFKGLRWIGYHLTAFVPYVGGNSPWITDARTFLPGPEPIDFAQEKGYRLTIERSASGPGSSFDVIIFDVNIASSSPRRISVAPYSYFPVSIVDPAFIRGLYWEMQIKPDDVDPKKFHLGYRRAGYVECNYRSGDSDARAARAFGDQRMIVGKTCGN